MASSASCLDSCRRQCDDDTMHKRVQIALAVLLAAVLGGALMWQCLRVQEPVYQGKRLSVWLDEGYGDGDFVAVTEQLAKRRTDEAVRQMSTNAVPMLLRRFRARDSSFRTWAMAWAQRQSVIKVSFTPARIRKYQGWLGVQALDGEASKEAVAELVKLLKDPDPGIRLSAASALNNIDPGRGHQEGR